MPRTQLKIPMPVGAADFAAYEATHYARITALVLPLMALELALAAGIMIYTPPAIPRWSAVAGLALVATNWVRTVAWALRGALCVWWLFLIGS